MVSCAALAAQTVVLSNHKESFESASNQNYKFSRRIELLILISDIKADDNKRRAMKARGTFHGLLPRLDGQHCCHIVNSEFTGWQ